MTEPVARRTAFLTRAVFGKWSTEILDLLGRSGPLGFGALNDRLIGITPRVLSGKLRRLEGQRLVRRTVVAGRPPRVRYAITDAGEVVVGLTGPLVVFLRGLDARRGVAPPARRNGRRGQRTG